MEEIKKNKNEDTSTSQSEESMERKDNSDKNRVKVFGLYLIYVIQSLYSIFIRFNDFSFSVEVDLTGGKGLNITILRLISYITARFMLFVGAYGIVATIFRDKIKDFYFWFTIASVLMFIISLLVMFLK